MQQDTVPRLRSSIIVEYLLACVTSTRLMMIHGFVTSYNLRVQNKKLKCHILLADGVVVEITMIMLCPLSLVLWRLLVS